MSNSALQWCRRYISITGLLLTGAIIYILFFQENSVARIYRNKKQIDSLEVAIKQNEDTMEYYHNHNVLLDNHDPRIIERIVREHHSMTLPNEDIYLSD